jgi:hypothetical protein
MRLYSGTTTTLAEDSAHNRIAGKLSDAFFRELALRSEFVAQLAARLESSLPVG